MARRTASPHVSKHVVVDRFNEDLTGTSEGILQRGMGTAAAASVPIGERYRGTKCTGEILGREREGGGEEEGVGGVGVRGKPGSKARRNFQQSRSLCWRAAKGVASRVYNAPMANSFPLSRHAYASVAYTCRKNSIAGENRSSRFRRRGGEISSHFPFFHFSPHFMSFARFHFDRAEYIYIKHKRVVEYVGLVLS